MYISSFPDFTEREWRVRMVIQQQVLVVIYISH